MRQGIPSHIVLQHTRTVVRQGKREVRMSEMQEEDYEYVGRYAYEDAPTEGEAGGRGGGGGRVGKEGQTGGRGGGGKGGARRWEEEESGQKVSYVRGGISQICETGSKIKISNKLCAVADATY